MISFKEANYKTVCIFGYEGAYTEDYIEDALPDGYKQYSLMSDGETMQLFNGFVEDNSAIIITKESIFEEEYKEIEPDDMVLEDNRKFSFEDFFNGIHRSIDYQINAAENKKNEQLQSKDRTKIKSFSQELL